MLHKAEFLGGSQSRMPQPRLLTKLSFALARLFTFVSTILWPFLRRSCRGPHSWQTMQLARGLLLVSSLSEPREEILPFSTSSFSQLSNHLSSLLAASFDRLADSCSLNRYLFSS